MGIALAIIGVVIFLAAIVYQIIFERKICREQEIKVLGRTNWLKVGFTAFAAGLGIMIAFIGAWVSHGEWTDGRAGHMAMALIGGFFFGAGLSALFSGFAFRYRQSAIEDKTKKIFSIACLVAIAPILGGLILFGEGFAPYLHYPLPAGITIMDNALKFYYAGSGKGSFSLSFYGLIIVSGVVVVYFICDRQFFLKFHKHNILDNVALVAFPAGIIGARIWYVVGNWERMFKGQPFGKVFAIWDGGLTILGGAAFGVIVGVLFVLFRRKYVKISFALDVCVPSILIAQAIGRWGNFFNCEVYGQVVSTSGWSFLPTWIINQMSITSGGAQLAAGNMHVPLFLIEGLLNIAGYFIIRYAIGYGFKKWLKGGELGASYFIWYGIVRFIMEPLRDPEFNMGSDNSWSVINSLMFILIGVALIVIIQLLAYNKKENHKEFIGPAIGGGLAILGLLLMLAPSLSVGRVISANEVEFIQYLGGFEMISHGSGVHLAALILMLLGGLTLLASVFVKKNKVILPAVSMALTIVASIIFLCGARWYDPYPQVSSIYNYSNSYGFAIYGMIGIFSALMAFVTIIPSIQKAIKNRKGAKENG